MGTVRAKLKSKFKDKHLNMVLEDLRTSINSIIDNPDDFTGTSATVTSAITSIQNSITNIYNDIDSDWVTDVTSKPFVDVRTFGAAGDGIADDTVAIQSAIDAFASGGVLFFPAGTYLTSSVIDMETNVVLMGTGYGTKITASTIIDGHDIFRANDKDRAGLVGLRIHGGYTKVADGVTFYAGSTRCFVQDCFFDNLGNNGVVLNASLYCRVVNNYFDSVGKNGVYVYAASHYNIVSNNQIISPANKGISIYNGSQYNLVQGNYLQDVGEASIFINDNDNTTHSNYNSVIGNISNRSGIIETSGGNGIEIGLESVGNIASGNIIIDVGYGQAGEGYPSEYGISVHGRAHLVTGNTVLRALYHGIYVYECRDSVISNNMVINSSQDGAGTYDGIRVHGTVDNVTHDNIISGNRCIDLQGTKTQNYGIQESSSYANFNLYINNILKDNLQTTGILLVGASSQARDNIHESSVSIASAGTITLLSTGEYFNITGTTTITSVTASWAGRRVVLKFAGVLTFTDGSNLLLAGDFVTTADDTITLVCNGTNWYEESRSIN